MVAKGVGAPLHAVPAPAGPVPGPAAAAAGPGAAEVLEAAGAAGALGGDEAGGGVGAGVGRRAPRDEEGRAGGDDGVGGRVEARGGAVLVVEGYGHGAEAGGDVVVVEAVAGAHLGDRDEMG